MIYDFDKSIYSGEPKKVRYQYFSEVEIQSIWNSNVTMTLKNISQSYIREQFKSLSGEELYSSYNSFYSPSVRTDYEVVLNLYKNKKTEDFFINYRKMVLQKNLSNIKKTELREKEKLLKKF